jgi:hypothetical protein
MQTSSKMGVIAVNKPSVLLKLAALASSVLVAGSFISYQAGAFNRLLAPRAATSESASDTPVTIMSGTKSRIFSSATSNAPDTFSTSGAYQLSLTISPDDPSSPPPDPPPTPPNGTSAEMTIMYGTKSPQFRGLIEGLTPAAQPDAAAKPNKPAQ